MPNYNVTNITFISEGLMEPIFKATNSLILELHIEDGNGLSFVLEQPEAETNKEAICLWVWSHIKDGKINMQRYLALKAKLESILSTLKGSQFA